MTVAADLEAGGFISLWCVGGPHSIISPQIFIPAIPSQVLFQDADCFVFFFFIFCIFGRFLDLQRRWSTSSVGLYLVTISFELLRLFCLFLSVDVREMHETVKNLKPRFQQVLVILMKKKVLRFCFFL